MKHPAKTLPLKSPPQPELPSPREACARLRRLAVQTDIPEEQATYAAVLLHIYELEMTVERYRIAMHQGRLAEASCPSFGLAADSSAERKT